MRSEKGRNRIATEVALDGEIFSESYPHHARHIPLESIGRVDLRLMEPESFSMRFLQDAGAYLGEVEKGFLRAVHCLRDARRASEGHAMLALSVDGLAALRSHMEGVFGVLGEEVRPEPMDRFWNRFGKVADDLREAQQARDDSQIASLLEEKLLPFLRQWREVA
jgi:hypothetical protein